MTMSKDFDLTRLNSRECFNNLRN